nr:bifunctional [glutamate--ammonia ligase]-adenylyl-L-tyrosine phosphorylase/[glutamate--ammonia-ligase] adenylyltransferase [Oceanococcus sp. HetDA_MAG_MS8]
MQDSPDYRLDLAALPSALRERSLELLAALGESAESAQAQPLLRCLLASRFVSDWARRNPAEFPALMTAAAAPSPPPQDDAGLRRYRNREMVRLACGQVLGRYTPAQIVEALSRLADQSIATMVDYHWQQLCAKKGQPVDARGRPIQPLVFALGKLGGSELNFSSDVDLVFAHSATAAAHSVAVEPLMAKLVQRVTRALSEPMEDGFVFRVDLRLRPFGSQGAPSFSLAALDSYFETHARDWERYAWQKARCVAGDVEVGESWLEGLTPFIYRRYIDFGQLAALKQMKDDIDADVRHKGREQDIKRGWGGIREMEFTVQALQLIHGGARPSLQQRSLILALTALHAEELVDTSFAQEWAQHYWFLRHVENCWQAVADAQSHVLPLEEEARQRLLAALGYSRWGEFEAALQAVRSRVRSHFLELFTPVEDAPLPKPMQELMVALESDDEPSWPAPFADLRAELEALKLAAQRRFRDADAQTEAFELALRLLDQAPDDATGRRVLALVTAICGRPQYLSLLRKHPEARRELLWLCQHSGTIAAELVQHPSLLVELCDVRTLYAPPTREALRQHIQRQISACDTEDDEAVLEQLRRIRHAVGLRIAAADVAHALPLMRVSDQLTELAEEVVRAALHWAQARMRQRWPKLGALPFAVVAYGKLGGMELSYSSDLDLVFVYRDGPIPGVDQDPQLFFTRLAQKLISALATQTAAGRCYEVDMRLRPNGNAGLLVTSLSAFARYQQESAWTWEHQALVRARPIVGQAEVIASFNELRLDILGRRRDHAALLQDIQDMRARMLKDKPITKDFDDKQSPGGLVDIEFYSQWLVLAHAAQWPALSRFGDVLRILESAAAADLIEPDTADTLAQRYRLLRERIHAQSLQSPEQAQQQLPALPLLQSFFGRQASTS